MGKDKKEKRKKSDRDGKGVKIKRGRPQNTATFKTAKKGSIQAKLNAAHKGMKVNDWLPEDMEEAIKAFEEDHKLPQESRRSFTELHEEFHVPRSTLWYRCKKLVQGFQHQSGGKNKGRSLEVEADNELANRAGE